MNFRSNVVVVSGDYTASMTDDNIFASASAGAFKIYLPDATLNIRNEYSVKLIGSNTNTITIIPSGTQQIEEGVSLVLNQRNEAVTLVSNGFHWWIF